MGDDAPSTDSATTAPAAPVAAARLETGVLDRPLTLADAAAPPVGHGGECLFLGRTRPERHPEHGTLRRLDYECHRPLAESALAGLAASIAADHGCGLVRILHATGPVAIGEASVLVQACAPHRPAAFAAARAGIDRLKREIPIWKQERWDGDAATWSAGTPVAPAATVGPAGPVPPVATVEPAAPADVRPGDPPRPDASSIPGASP